MSAPAPLLSLRQLCFFTHHPQFTRAAELVRHALRARGERADGDASDAYAYVRDLLAVEGQAVLEVELLDELLFVVEKERESVSDAAAQCTAAAVCAHVLVNERWRAVHALMSYVEAGGALLCDGRCAWPSAWAVEDNEPRRAALEARRSEYADWLAVLDWRFDAPSVRRQIAALERATFVELAVGLAPLQLPVLLVLAVGEWLLRCDLDWSTSCASGAVLRDYALSPPVRWRVAARVQQSGVRGGV